MSSFLNNKMLGSGLLPHVGVSGYISFQTNKSGTFNPSVTVSDGSLVTWDYGDGTTSTGATANRTYPDSTTKTVTVTFANPAAVTHLDFQSQSLVGTFNLSQLSALTGLLELRGYSNASWNVTGGLGDMPSTMTYLHLGSTSSTVTGGLGDMPSTMTQLYLFSTSSTITGGLGDMPSTMTYLYLFNTSSTIAGGLGDMPSGMMQLYLYNTSSTVTGGLGDMPSGMTQLHLGSTSSTVTGGLGDMPSGMTQLYLYSTSSTITGGVSAPLASGLKNAQFYSCNYSQAQLDELLQYIYTHRAQWTHSAPVLHIGGTNPAPSGTYADEDPPTTGKGYIYELVVDPESEGFKKWAITYTV